MQLSVNRKFKSLSDIQNSLRALCCQSLKLSRCLCGYRLETLRERKTLRNKVLFIT